MSTPFLTHSRASRLVRSWRAKPVGNSLQYTVDDSRPGYTLRFPGEGYLVQVSFHHVEGHPELMRVRSTNWRAEDEPNGVYKVEDCRQFWAELRRAGLEEVSHD